VILIPRTIQLKEGRLPLFSYKEYFPTRLTAENPMAVGFANALAQEGAQVDIYLSGSFTTAPTENLRDGVRVVYLKDHFKGLFNPGWMPLNLSLLTKIKKGKYDVVIVGDYVQPATVIASLVCLTMKIPLMVWQELDTEMRFPANILSRMMFWSNVRLSFPRIAKFVPRSEKAQSFLTNHGIDRRLVTEILPHGVDTSIFQRKATISWRQKLRISESEIIVLTVSRIEPCKGLDDLVDAARMLVNSHPTLRFVIKGSGSGDIELRRRISEAGLNDYFTIISEKLSREELAELYAESNLFVAPSRTDLLIFSPIAACCL
jgi:glycosyltransferase involved in cell wall biosynthesis